MQLTYYFAVLASLALSAVNAVYVDSRAASAAQIHEAMNAIRGNAATFSSAVTAFPVTDGTLDGALQIHYALVSLDTSMKQLVEETTATPRIAKVDEAEILASVQTIAPIVIDALGQITTKKAALQALTTGNVADNVTSLIYADISALSTDSSAFEEVLASKLDSNDHVAARAPSNGCGAAFDTVLAN